MILGGTFFCETNSALSVRAGRNSTPWGEVLQIKSETTISVPPSLRSSSFSFPFFLCSFFVRKVSRSITLSHSTKQNNLKSSLRLATATGWCSIYHIQHGVCHRFSCFWRAQQWVSISESSQLNHTQAFLRKSNVRSNCLSISEETQLALYLRIKIGNLLTYDNALIVNQTFSWLTALMSLSSSFCSTSILRNLQSLLCHAFVCGVKSPADSLHRRWVS